MLSEFCVIMSFIAIVVFIYVVFFWQEERIEPVNRKEDEREVLSLAQISSNWQDSVETVPTKPEPVIADWRIPPVFDNQEIVDFYSRTIDNNYSIKRPEWAVICRILELLDKFGGCPSVVCDF